MTSVAYVDASALVKLILVERGSRAMYRWYVESERALTSRAGIIETHRAIARHTAGVDRGHVESVLASLEIIELDATVGRLAAALGPPELRTLDAIHLASALQLGELDAFVTYDDRLATAARAAMLPVVRPA